MHPQVSPLASERLPGVSMAGGDEACRGYFSPSLPQFHCNFLAAIALVVYLCPLYHDVVASYAPRMVAYMGCL